MIGRDGGQGAIQETGNPLDVAIQGEGFLRVRLPDGREGLTRDGGLHVDGVEFAPLSTPVPEPVELHLLWTRESRNPALWRVLDVLEAAFRTD